MRNRACLNNFFSRERKTLYIILSIVIISVLTLTVVYAALLTTLNINGNAEVIASSWDIYLDNVQLNSNSATSNVPTITDKTTTTFSTTLSKPGDFYEFTIDVVNNGSIDAIIDSVTKTPELSVTQKKYLNYIVEYQNGETITTKQLVSKNSFVRLKVKVEFRKDITASNLPTTSETLNLSFKVNYVQSDDSSENITINNNGKWPKLISGDLETVGSEVAIGDEHFYIISSDEKSITMLAKYNLYVGNECTTSSLSSCTPYKEEATGIQDSTMIARPSDNGYPRKGTVEYSLTNYWDEGYLKSEYGTGYPVYVYDNNSTIFTYVENYRHYLENKGIIVNDARLIKIEELELLGCDKIYASCANAPSWIYSTSYWTGTAESFSALWYVNNGGSFYYFAPFANNGTLGIRPVITIAA